MLNSSEWGDRGLKGSSIALILSGGSIRGAAHIGVIRRLEEIGLSDSVDFVAGTSAGALVGALYALGYDSFELEEAFKESATKYNLFDIDYWGLVKGILTPAKIQSIFKGDRITKRLRVYLGCKEFKDLKRNFCTIATDINTGEGRILSSGQVVPAIRASMAIPAVYAPVRIDGRLLVDGGVTDYLPLRALDVLCGFSSTYGGRRRCSAVSAFSKVLAVNLGYAGRRNECVDGAFEYITQSVDIQGANLSKMIIDHYPIARIINPNVYDVGSFDTTKIDYCIRKGYLTTKKIVG